MGLVADSCSDQQVIGNLVLRFEEDLLDFNLFKTKELC